jgi:hypothetical protein
MINQKSRMVFQGWGEGLARWDITLLSIIDSAGCRACFHVVGWLIGHNGELAACL